MVDPHAVIELELYINNDGNLYRQQTTSLLKNLIAKRARGEYKHDLAVKAFGYLVEAGAKKYAQESGSPSQPWYKMFDVETRKEVAEELTKAFETEAKLGNYDHLLPKKYQKLKASGTGHARKKLQWKTPESIKVAWSPVNQAYFALWPGRGKIEDQQVLKIAPAEEMHGWLRDTYGEAYGLAGRVGRGSTGHTPKKTPPAGHSTRRESPARYGHDFATAPRSRAQLDQEIKHAIGPQAYALYRGGR
jgi:hypothetical protein